MNESVALIANFANIFTKLHVITLQEAKVLMRSYILCKVVLKSMVHKKESVHDQAHIHWQSCTAPVQMIAACK